MRGYPLPAGRVFSQARSVLCRQPHPLSHRIRVEARTLMSEEEHKTEEKQKEECKEKKLLGLEPVETQHELVLEARSIKYTARGRYQRLFQVNRI